MPLCHGRRDSDAESEEVPPARSRARRALLSSSGKLRSDGNEEGDLRTVRVWQWRNTQCHHARLEVDAGIYSWRSGLQCGEGEGGSAPRVLEYICSSRRAWTEAASTVSLSTCESVSWEVM